MNFGRNNKVIIVTDNLAKYYALDVYSGDLLWSKINSSVFNSEIKVINDKFFLVDKENIIYCFSTKNGEKLWSYQTENFFIKSNKKLSIVLYEDKVVFNNSIGDITALDINKGSLLWQTPTQNSLIYADTILLKTSSLVVDEDNIIFSNNKNEFYSIDRNDGFINWKQTINSEIKPLVTNKIILTVSNEGFLFFVDALNGNIIKTQDLFLNFKEKKRQLLKPIGIALGVDKLFITLNNGFLLVAELKNGKIVKTIKIDNNKISKPYIFNKKIFVIKDNSLVELS